MSDMKCPFCNGELERVYSRPFQLICGKCGSLGTDELWQELIRTKELLDIESSEHEMCHDAMVKRTEEVNRIRKALDVAVGKLKGIKAYYDDNYADPHTFVNWHIVAQRLANDADDAIKEITELEQKDVKCGGN